MSRLRTYFRDFGCALTAARLYLRGLPGPGQVSSDVIDRSFDGRPAYRLGASCGTCGWDGEVRRQCGFEPPARITCTRCGCSTVEVKRGDFRGRDS